jgi:hypothetical protein
MRLLFLFLLILNQAVGQTASVGVSFSLPSVALLDIEPNRNSFNLGLSTPTDAGNSVGNTASDNSKWINFSSAVTSGQTRRISAQISGTMPNGLSLILNTSTYSGGGAGTLGTRVSPLTLTAAAQTIINGIGGAYTGSGGSNGYNLTFTLSIGNYSQLRSQSTAVSIIYTLIDN